MSQYIPVPVEAAKRIAKDFFKSQVIILAYDDEHKLTHTTTYGESAFDKENAASVGEILSLAIGCDLGKKQVFEDFHNDYDPAKLKRIAEMVTIELREGFEDEKFMCHRCTNIVDVRVGCDFEPGDVCDSCAQEIIHNIKATLCQRPTK